MNHRGCPILALPLLAIPILVRWAHKPKASCAVLFDRWEVNLTPLWCATARNINDEWRPVVGLAIGRIGMQQRQLGLAECGDRLCT